MNLSDVCVHVCAQTLSLGPVKLSDHVWHRWLLCCQNTWAGFRSPCQHISGFFSPLSTRWRTEKAFIALAKNHSELVLSAGWTSGWTVVCSVQTGGTLISGLHLELEVAFFSSLLDVTLHQLRLQSCVQVISDWKNAESCGLKQETLFI